MAARYSTDGNSLRKSPGLLSAVLAGFCVVGIFLPTASSMVSEWKTSDTFTHGFLVVPIAFWLAWRVRDRLTVDPEDRPDYLMLLPAILSGGVWLLGDLANVLVIEQIGFVGLLISTLALVLGRRLSRLLRFPLLFLLFAAPVGAEIVPYLMEFTADITVGAIRLVGIPVYRNGLYFSLPTGDWSIVEACSGIRYLIASIMLGTLYSGLFIKGIIARSAFMILAIAIPLIANSVRAFGIVILGHSSNMRIATGADHLLYGWLFFGLIMFCLFAIGSFFPQTAKNEKQVPGDTGATNTRGVHHLPSADGSRPRAVRVTVAGCALAIGVATLFPAWAAMASRAATPDYVDGGDTSMQWLPDFFSSNGSRLISMADGWAPEYHGHDREDTGFFTSANLPESPRGSEAESAVVARAYVYFTQEQGKELIGYRNRLVSNSKDAWRIGEQRTKGVSIPGTTGTHKFEVLETHLGDGYSDLVVWSWYAIGDVHTSNKLEGKIAELLLRLTLDRRPSVGYVLAVDANSPDAERSLFDAFRAIVAHAGCA